MVAANNRLDCTGIICFCIGGEKNGANIASYEGMLIIDEHAEGLQITLNYTTKSESLVNAILADSSTTAHVVKGSLIS